MKGKNSKKGSGSNLGDDNGGFPLCNINDAVGIYFYHEKKGKEERKREATFKPKE